MTSLDHGQAKTSRHFLTNLSGGGFCQSLASKRALTLGLAGAATKSTCVDLNDIMRHLTEVSGSFSPAIPISLWLVTVADIYWDVYSPGCLSAYNCSIVATAVGRRIDVNSFAQPTALLEQRCWVQAVTTVAGLDDTIRGEL